MRKKWGDNMKIVGVTACTTGIAHTYMAQEALEKECKKRGYEVKIETQGGMGIDNELTEDEINEADAVILAIAIGIEGEERFEEKSDEGKVITMDPSNVIKNVVDVVNQLENL
jgi:fructose PTS system EIIB component